MFSGKYLVLYSLLPWGIAEHALHDAALDPTMYLLTYLLT